MTYHIVYDYVCLDGAGMGVEPVEADKPFASLGEAREALVASPKWVAFAERIRIRPPYPRVKKVLISVTTANGPRGRCILGNTN